MENNNNLTTEELKKKCHEAKETYESLKQQVKIAEQEEADRKKAQFALEKDARKKELDEAFARYKALMDAYIKDYKVYSTTYSTNDINSYIDEFKRFFW